MFYKHVYDISCIAISYNILIKYVRGLLVFKPLALRSRIYNKKYLVVI